MKINQIIVELGDVVGEKKSDVKEFIQSIADKYDAPVVCRYCGENFDSYPKPEKEICLTCKYGCFLSDDNVNNIRWCVELKIDKLGSGFCDAWKWKWSEE
jgi:hypothetical protein